MNEVSDQKAKPDGDEKLVYEGSAARTRATSVEEIMLRRKRKDSLENLGAQLLGNDLVEKASDYHESGKGYDKSKEVSREEGVENSLRKKEDAISNSTEERQDKSRKEDSLGAVQLVGNNLVEKVSDYHESEKGNDRSEKPRHGELVNDSSRNKEEAISSSKDEKLDKEGTVGAATLLGNDLGEKVSDDHASEKGNDKSKKVRHEDRGKDSSRKKEDATSSSKNEGPDKPRKDDHAETAQLLGNDLVEKVSDCRASDKELEKSKKVSCESVKDSSRKKEEATSRSREGRLDKPMKKDPVDKVSDYRASGREHDRSKKLRPGERVKDSSKKKEDTISSAREEKSMKDDPVGAAQLLSNDLVEKVSDYHESKKGYHRSEKLRREEDDKDRLRKKVDAISSCREEKLDKPRGGEVSPPSRRRRIHTPLIPDLRLQLAWLTFQSMGSHGKSRSGKQKKKKRRDESESESESYSDGSDDLSPPRRRKGSRSSSSRSRRRRSSDDDSSDSDGGRKSKKRTSSKKPSEEEIKEYLAKKAQKKALRAAKKLKTQSVSGYSNDSNPFGDSNLTETFVWRKKIEKDVHHGVPLDEFSVKAEKRRRGERMTEVEKVKKRREERAVEKARHEEEMALLARERARAEFQDWEKKEEEFHFDQSKVRSEIRLREGRLKPIDVLCKHLDGSDDMDIELSEPYMVFKGLNVKDMEELRDDIKMYLDSDRATPTRVQYWEALIVVCDWELAEARKRDALDRARVRGEEPPAELLAQERGLHAGVEADVRKLLDGKTHSELLELQLDIESQLRSGSAKVVEYWEAVLKRLDIYKAKACLKEIHAEMLRRHLHRLEQLSEGDEEDVEVNRRLAPVMEENEEEEINDTNLSDAEEAFSPEPVMEEEEEADVEAEAAGSFSPELMHGDDREEAIDPEEDRKLLEMKRMVVMEKQKKRIKEAMDSKPPPVEDNFKVKAMKAMGAMEEGDAVFGSNAEVNLDSEVYWWHDKYRPRKPKYFNRVHTGYEWNKYNQTHYDHDNPPPKIVQGYKFNIFYPDLVDKIKAPIYTIEKDGTSSETCMIRFHAGPPYEDIAFRIVNKEWEYSHKKGFKCTFERGILHLYINFKRHRYRR